MKLIDMGIRNYRQFEKEEISFDDGITVLAGANNSGKTSLITLIKNVFMDENRFTMNQMRVMNTMVPC